MDERDWFWQHGYEWIYLATERWEHSNSSMSVEEYTYNLIMEEERNESKRN